MKTKLTDRRDFLKASAAATLFPAPFVRAQSKDQKYRTALIGSGWWGMNILREAMAAGASTVVAMCDVDENQLNPAAAEVEKLSGDQPKKYKDYREMLRKERPEIVIVGTPDHWHALCMIAAVNAGAHVYVEKPISHTIKEGRAMVNAARAANRVVQVGTHRRVSPHNVSGREFIKSGKLGKIGMVRAFVHYGGGPEQPKPNEEPPKGLDWDMWCGPAPLRPFNRGIHAKGFRQFLDYANGQLGDWGVHWLDQILWITGEKYPKRIFSTGGRPIRGPLVNTKEAQTTDAPDHQVAVYEFDQFTVSWEHRLFSGNNAEKTHPVQAVGCYFYGTNGTFHMGWVDGWTFYPVKAEGQVIHEDAKLNKPDDQNIKELWADFLDAINTERKPVSDIEQIHYSTNLALLGMLSLKLRRSIEWDGAKEQVIGDSEANRNLSRKYRGSWEYPKA
ncbi:MAG TPA: Gfo/Idh/MocA family oxidoreductase [Blastocatellia bacterium]|nr:Gfo/Idh/MocA family oxidoreductase [Blastocatellia bacterium]